MFDADAKASARQVTKIRPVVEKGTGARGEIVGTAPGGFLKVKWLDRAGTSLIKRSEIKRRSLRANPKRGKTIWAHTAKPTPGGAKEEKARLSKLYFDAGKRLARENNFSSASTAFRVLFTQTPWRYDRRVGFTKDDAEKAFTSGYKGRRKNPSVTAIAEKFQGKADGMVEEFYAANGAPSNLARAGKLVFLKVSGKTIRVPGAMVAIAPSEKIWITGTHAPLFKTKAKRGQGLDVGEVSHICYETAKAHIGGGKTFEYVHEFGEEGGKRPHLIIDSDGMPILRGGDYKIKVRRDC
jgi:hypothetical protein